MTIDTDRPRYPTQPPPMAEDLDRRAAELEPVGGGDFMGELAKLIQSPPEVPVAGVQASAAIRQCTDHVIADIRAMAKENVDRALEVQQSAETFCTIIQQAGDRVCEDIERNAGQARQIKLVLEMTRDAFFGPSAQPPAQN